MEVDRTGSGSCPVAGFRISDSGNQLIRKTDLRQIGC